MKCAASGREETAFAESLMAVVFVLVEGLVKSLSVSEVLCGN